MALRPHNPPFPQYAFRYRQRPISGNEINGHNSPNQKRANIVFHSDGDSIDWLALDRFFSLINPLKVIHHFAMNVWQLRNAEPRVSVLKTAVDDPNAMSEQVKSDARELGAALVGITEITDAEMYQGKDISHRYAVCIGMPMDRDEMEFVPEARAAIEVMRTYRVLGKIAVKLAQHIAGMGYPARAYGSPNCTDILHIPLAQRAGLGQLGKHGSLISKEYGSNFRLATVVTDLPLAVDTPRDIGVDDLCLNCRRCVVDCPPDAIFDSKQLVRGETKWYVNFDKCIPYFTKTHGCSICIEVCPWSTPGRGPALSQKLLAKRSA